MACTWLVDGAVRRRWYPDRWVEFESTVRGRVPVPEPMGRIRFDSARTSTSTRVDEPSSIGQLYYGYQWSVGGPVRFDYPNLWLTVGRVRFVTPRSIDGLSRVEFDLSIRGASMVDHVSSLLRHTDVCRWWSWVEVGWQHHKCMC
jgi:hypothetical protein